MKQPVNKFRYTISNRLGVLQASPFGESNFTIEWTREDDGRLDYKNELPNKIIFRGAVYDNLLTLEQSIYRCDFVSITVERRCIAEGVETWVPWFSGRMSFNDGAWDLDRCEVEIKLDDIKEEQCFEDNKSKELDLLQSIVTRRTVFLNPTNITIEKVFYTSVDACDGLPVWGGAGEPFSQGWIVYKYDFEIDYNFDPDKCTATYHWARETTLVDCGDPAPGADWILIEDTCPGGQKKYARPARLYGCTYLFPELGSDIEVTQYNCSVIGDTASRVSIDNGLSLEDVTELFMNSFCPGLTFVSNFFQINPDVVSAINYVTGQPSKTRFLTLFQKSDVKRPSVGANATKAVLSFEKLMEFLITMFNLRWRIEGSILRMEHVSYFSKNSGFNLTQARWAPYVVGKRKYTYENQDIPAREEFRFMEFSVGGDFQGLPIFYSGGCVSQASRNNVKTFAAEKITTDMELVLGNPEPDSKTVSDEGFVLVAADFDGTEYFVITEAAILGGNSLNNSLAWAQLHRDYYKHDRPLRSGIMNNIDTLFFSTKPTKKGEKITIPLCCNDTFNPDDTVQTALGTGIVDKATFSFKDETLELELLYPADEDLTSNTAPVAVNDVISTYIDTPILIDVLDNDSDADPGSTITAVEIVVPPAHGSAVVQPDKRILYTPESAYVGDDNIVYRILDNWSQASNNALVAIDVLPTNQPPTAVDDEYIAEQDTTLNVPAGSGLFDNDSDDVSFSLDDFDATSVEGGTVTVNADGSFSYDPPTGYVGIDTFTYTIIDGLGLTDTATVTIDVRNPNNPVANPDAYQTRKNQNLTVLAPGVLVNDSTTVGVLAADAETIPTDEGGSVTISADGQIAYTPPTGFVGNDSFDYTAENGTGTDIGTVTVQVLPDIFVKVQQISFNNDTLEIDCGGDLQHGGIERRGRFRLFFYSNAGGTIPIDVTGLNLTVNMRITGTTLSGSYTDDFSVNVSGTTYDLFGGVAYLYSYEILDCEGNLVEEVNESITVQPGNYTVI